MKLGRFNFQMSRAHKCLRVWKDANSIPAARFYPKWAGAGGWLFLLNMERPKQSAFARGSNFIEPGSLSKSWQRW